LFGILIFQYDFVFLRLDFLFRSILDWIWIFFEVLGFQWWLRAVDAVAADRNLEKAAAHGGEPPLVYGKVKNIWIYSWRIERSVLERREKREKKKKNKKNLIGWEFITL
jgi:hypothetical protein